MKFYQFIIRKPCCVWTFRPNLPSGIFELLYLITGNILQTANFCISFWNLEIRLVGGNNANEGRVELLHQGKWGTVCDDNFDRNSADVVCRMMDMGTASYWGNRFGPGTGDILLEVFDCTGKESSLFDCLHQGIKKHNCFHWQDIGVTCTGSKCLSKLYLLL